MEFIDLKKQYSCLKNEIDGAINNVLKNCNYILGDEVSQLECKLAEYVGTKYCITCANGTDALVIALKALGITSGDVVFVPSFTFFASGEAIAQCGATPIFVDVNERTFNIDSEKLEQAIKRVVEKRQLKAKAIMTVDLFGLPADYNAISKIAEKYNLKIIEDGAQGFGGSIGDRKACSFGDIATTSFFPAKPLGCYGDGGAIFTSSEALYKTAVSLRFHGKGDDKYDNINIGYNSRLDTIQAAVLLVKLKAFKGFELDRRNNIANLYNKNLTAFKTPFIPKGFVSSYAQYTLVLDNADIRNELMKKLKQSNIPSMVYYPKPLHKQTAFNGYSYYGDLLNVSEDLCNRVLSLPMHPYLEDNEVEYISGVLNK